MSIVKGDFEMKCNKCGKIHVFPAADADFEDVGGEEKQMGTENEYAWETEFECDCGNQIEIDYRIWEYPEGAFNDDDPRVQGGKPMKNFEYDFHGEPDED